MSRHVNRNHVGTWSSHNPQPGLQVRAPCPVSHSFVCCLSLRVYVARRVGGISHFDFGKKEGPNDMLFQEDGAPTDFRISFRVWDFLDQKFPRMRIDIDVPIT
jgi:hypothetical protein